MKNKMKIIKLLKDSADKLISVLNIQKSRGYKYCTTVHIHNDVSTILKNRRAIENPSTRILQKLR